MEAKQRAMEIARRWMAALTQALEAGASQPLKTGFTETDRVQAASLANPQVLEFEFESGTGAALWVAAEAETMARLKGGLEQAARGLQADTARSGEARAALPEYAAAVFAVAIESDGAKSQLFLGISEALSESLKTQAGPLTFDLLLDVELPLSVSFGRTYLPVRDILKLSTGSIVELNCAANECVDVIVNNCTIARGEVVVVEGNYGVRIDEIISRKDRMMLQHRKGLNPGRPMRIGA